MTTLCHTNLNRDFKAEDVEHKNATKRGPTQRSRFCCRFAGRVTIPTGVFARPFAAGDDAQLHRAEFHAKLDTALIKARPTSPQFACKMQNRIKKKKKKKNTANAPVSERASSYVNLRTAHCVSASGRNVCFNVCPARISTLTRTLRANYLAQKTAISCLTVHWGASRWQRISDVKWIIDSLINKWNG